MSEPSSGLDEPAHRLDAEELLHDLTAVCEAFRVLCARGDGADLRLTDAESLALLVVQLAADLTRCVLDGPTGAPPTS